MSKKVKGPLDPTEDFEGITNDSTGLTGITKNEKNSNSNDINNEDKGTIATSSDYKSDANDDISSLLDSEDLVDRDTVEIDEVNTADSGEQSISGDMPSPDSDDDVLQNAKEMGIGIDEDEEHPKELDIGGDIDKSEESIKTH